VVLIAKDEGHGYRKKGKSGDFSFPRMWIFAGVLLGEARLSPCDCLTLLYTLTPQREDWTWHRNGFHFCFRGVAKPVEREIRAKGTRQSQECERAGQ